MEKQDIERRELNAKKSLAVAAALFPDEKWINTEKNIYVAKNRMIEKVRERKKWEREMSQVRILASRGTVVYFLPEKKNEGKGKLKNRPKNGSFICYFEHMGELYKWSYEELRMLIKKSPGPTAAEPGSAGWDSGAR